MTAMNENWKKQLVEPGQLEAGRVVTPQEVQQVGLSYLHYLTREGTIEQLRGALSDPEMTDQGVNVQDGIWGATSLAHAVAISVGDFRKIKLLLENGADPNKADKEGYTALHVAVKASAHAKLVPLICCNSKVPVSMDLPDKDGMTPLMLALQLDQGVLAAELFMRGASLSVTNKEGKRPVQVAIDNGSFRALGCLMTFYVDNCWNEFKQRCPSEDIGLIDTMAASNPDECL